jgi:hypothetical protein
MASHGQSGRSDGGPGNAIEEFIDTIFKYGNNASHNFQSSFSNMTPRAWIRLIAIVGGYFLIRPFLLKMAANHAMKTMEEEQEKEKQKQKAKISPNELRGVSDMIEDQEAEETGDGTAADWGQKARLRQRKVVRQLLEAEEMRRLEEEEDKFIEELLTQ